MPAQTAARAAALEQWAACARRAGLSQEATDALAAEAAAARQAAVAAKSPGERLHRAREKVRRAEEKRSAAEKEERRARQHLEQADAHVAKVRAELAKLEAEVSPSAAPLENGVAELLKAIAGMPFAVLPDSVRSAMELVHKSLATDARVEEEAVEEVAPNDAPSASEYDGDEDMEEFDPGPGEAVATYAARVKKTVGKSKRRRVTGGRR